MKPETTTDYDPVPEGLEFDERYMDAAFALYDEEKKERKRRILIWIWSASAGMAAVLLLLTVYFINNSDYFPSSARSKPAKTVHNSGKESAVTANQSRAKAPDANTPVVDESNGKKPINKVPSEKEIPTKRYPKSPTPKSIDNTSKPTVDLTDNGLSGTEFYQSTRTTQVAHHGRKSQHGLMKSLPVIIPESDSSATLEAAHLFNDSSDSVARSLPHLPDPKEERDHRLYINTGINTLFGMSQLQSGFHLRETVGLNYDYRFPKRFTLSTQLELYTLPGISHTQNIGSVSSNNESISLTKVTLHYLTLAPRLDVRVREKHHLALGTGVEYLILNPGEKFEIRDYTGDKTSGKSVLFYQTFNRFNWFVSASYGFDLSKRFSLYGTYYFGLSDMTKNSSNSTTFDRNSRLQLMLRMRIF